MITVNSFLCFKLETGGMLLLFVFYFTVSIFIFYNYWLTMTRCILLYISIIYKTEKQNKLRNSIKNCTDFVIIFSVFLFAKLIYIFRFKNRLFLTKLLAHRSRNYNIWIRIRCDTRICVVKYLSISN